MALSFYRTCDVAVLNCRKLRESIEQVCYGDAVEQVLYQQNIRHSAEGFFETSSLFLALFSGVRQLRSNESSTVSSTVCFESKAADIPIITSTDIFPLLPVPVAPPPGQNTSSTRSEFGVPLPSQLGRSGFDMSKPEETPSVQPAPIPDLTQSYYQVSSFLRKNMESVGSKMSGVVKKGIGRE